MAPGPRPLSRPRAHHPRTRARETKSSGASASIRRLPACSEAAPAPARARLDRARPSTAPPSLVSCLRIRPCRPWLAGLARSTTRAPTGRRGTRSSRAPAHRRATPAPARWSPAGRVASTTSTHRVHERCTGMAARVRPGHTSARRDLKTASAAGRGRRLRRVRLVPRSSRSDGRDATVRSRGASTRRGVAPCFDGDARFPEARPSAGQVRARRWRWDGWRSSKLLGAPLAGGGGEWSRAGLDRRLSAWTMPPAHHRVGGAPRFRAHRRLEHTPVRTTG